MNLDFLYRLLTFVIVLLVQALILNHIHLFNYATPMLYVWPVLHFPYNYPRWATLVWCFLMGLGIDIFSNTPGVAAASMTLIGLLQPYVLQLFMPRDSADDFVAGFRTLGTNKFAYYALILCGVFCLCFFTLEAFNFFHWVQWLANIGGSILLTLVLILVIENLYRK